MSNGVRQRNVTQHSYRSMWPIKKTEHSLTLQHVQIVHFASTVCYFTCRKTYSTSVLYKLIESPPCSKTNVFSSPIFGIFRNALHTRKRLSRNSDMGMAWVPGPISIVASFVVILSILYYSLALFVRCGMLFLFFQIGCNELMRSTFRLSKTGDAIKCKSL